jgi:hypothetical protein
VTEAVEHMLCKCEALSSNFSPTKKILKLVRFIIDLADHCGQQEALHLTQHVDRTSGTLRSRKA